MLRQAALRAFTFEWARILHRCWVDRVRYGEARQLLAIQKRQKPILAVAASLPASVVRLRV